MSPDFLVSAPFKPLPAPRCRLGETPIYDDRSEVFYWVDIKGSSVFAYALKTGEISTFKVPPLTSAALLTEDPKVLVLTSQSGLYAFNIEEEISEKLLSFDFTDLRPNEAQASPDGTLWISFMGIEAKMHAGALYRASLKDRRLHLVKEAMTIPNTLVFYREQVIFFDTFEGAVFTSTLSGTELKRETVRLCGSPDGSALTKDGLLLNANWGQGILRLLDPADNFAEVFHQKVPPLQPSSCALGGNDFKTLLVTSAYDGLDRIGAEDGLTFTAPSNLMGVPSYRIRLS